MDKCKICKGNFEGSPDSLLLCGYKDGFVHLGCCINCCSYDKHPCGHAICTYEKI